MSAIVPDINRDTGVPYCSEEACPSFDGKRCEYLGARPSAICEPAVGEMVRLIKSQRDELEELRPIAEAGIGIVNDNQGAWEDLHEAVAAYKDDQ